MLHSFVDDVVSKILIDLPDNPKGLSTRNSYTDIVPVWYISLNGCVEV